MGKSKKSPPPPTLLLLFVSALLCAQLVNGQKVDSAKLSSQVRHDRYIQKWNLNRAIGGIFGTAGLAMVGVSFLTAFGHIGEADSNAGQGLLIAGATSLAVSIPFFIWAIKQ